MRSTHYGIATGVVVTLIAIIAIIAWQSALQTEGSRHDYEYYKNTTPVDPKDVSWEGVTLEQPGIALINGHYEPEGRACASSTIPMELKVDRDANIGGLWSRTAWSDKSKCVFLVEYGYYSRDDIKEFKDNDPPAMKTEVPVSQQ